MAVAVDIFVSTDELIPAPVAGATVALLGDNQVVAGVAQSDSSGHAGFVLPGGLYEVRVFKLGTVFRSPNFMLVVDPVVTTNRFDVTGTPLSFTPSLDPRVCRCIGRFVDLANKPVRGATMRVSQRSEAGFETPKVVDGNLVSVEGMSFQTGGDGFLTIDLLRGGEYYVLFSGESDAVWNIKVPDRATVNLIDLIHPQPVSLFWDSVMAPGSAVSLLVNDIVTVPFSVLFSDFETLTSGLSRWVQLASSAPTVASVQYHNDSAYIRGVAPGTAQVLVSVPPGLFPVRIPDYAIYALPLLVTIS